MVKVYLFIELLRAANAADIVTQLKAIELDGCRFANILTLADDKLVAQLDCQTGAEANTAILSKIIPVQGIVQTNVISAVTPVHR